MFGNTWDRGRRIALLVIVLCLLAAGWYCLGPGLPVVRSPRAAAGDVALGRELFEHPWQVHDALAGGDGLGPVFNDTSCAACHSQGGLGGGGDPSHNVQAFEVIPTRLDRVMRTGQVHAFSVAPEFAESPALLRKVYPVVPGGIISSSARGGRRDLDPVRVIPVNSTSLFGAGWIDRISTQSIRTNSTRTFITGAARELGGDFQGVMPGRARVLADGRIGRFGWKAQFATLREFVAAACGSELGLSTPIAPQATPLGQKSDAAATHAVDLDERKFAALVGFVDTLPRPVEVTPANPADAALAGRGKELFTSVGCAACHTPELGGVSGIYSDLLLHVVEDPETIAQEYYETAELEVALSPALPAPGEWRTPPLWGVADSAPYFHDGKSATLGDAILRHRGSASGVTQRYRRLGGEQEAILAFLGTLKAPPSAEPAKPATAEPVRIASR